jgi:invasion protein IalB
MIEYSFCGRRLCLATAPFDAKAAATVEASKKVSASYVRGSKQLVQVPLDLSGFREAYDFIVKQLS